MIHAIDGYIFVLSRIILNVKKGTGIKVSISARTSSMNVWLVQERAEMEITYKKFLKRKYRGNMMEGPPETELKSYKLIKRIEYLSSIKNLKISLILNHSFNLTVHLSLS